MKKFFRKLLDYIVSIMNPGFYLSSEKTCMTTDKIVNRVLDEYESGDRQIRSSSDHTIELVNDKRPAITLWISNYPYASGNIYGDDLHGLPTRVTRIRLNRLVKKIRAQREAERLSKIEQKYL